MKLKEYMKENCINVRLFARKLGISLATIYSIFDGQDVRLSTALKIEEGTKQQVKCRDMTPTSTRARPIKKQKKESEADNEA